MSEPNFKRTLEEATAALLPEVSSPNDTVIAIPLKEHIDLLIFKAVAEAEEPLRKKLEERESWIRYLDGEVKRLKEAATGA